MEYQFSSGLPDTPLLASLLDLHLRVFKGQTREEVLAELAYQDNRGPLLLIVALAGRLVVGYKIGYERKPGHFYSWLGCVAPESRGRGIATVLMRLQHDWCLREGYNTVSTQTYNRWREMLLLNIKHEFDIVGTKQGVHGLLILMEKRLSGQPV